jgi:hypothetical protein
LLAAAAVAAQVVLPVVRFCGYHGIGYAVTSKKTAATGKEAAGNMQQRWASVALPLLPLSRFMLVAVCVVRIVWLAANLMACPFKAADLCLHQRPSRNVDSYAQTRGTEA